jgi:hypothetical protein
MPKYCVRTDGAVYPYNPTLATNARFKIVDELPAEHTRGIEKARGRADERVMAAQLMREQQDARDERRRQQSEGLRRQISTAPAVDPAASEEAQRQADEFSGREQG